MSRFHTLFGTAGPDKLRVNAAATGASFVRKVFTGADASDMGLFANADGSILGSALKVDGNTRGAVDPARGRGFMDRAMAAR